MLLLRMRRQFRNQDWFIVVLEFASVVIGVVSAFQLQSWGEGYFANLRAERSLHQLYEESEDVLWHWINEVDFRDNLLDMQDLTVAAFARGEQGEIDDRELSLTLAWITNFATATPPRRAFDELQSAGLLTDINAPQAMAFVSDYYETLEFVDRQGDVFRPGFELRDELRFGRGFNHLYDRTAQDHMRLEVDFDALAADPVFVDTLVLLLRDQMRFQSYRRALLHTAADMCVSLAEAVGKECERYDRYAEISAEPDWGAPEEGQ